MSEPVARVVFAASLIALGIQGLIHGDFAGIWDSVPKSVPARALMGHVCASVSLASGAGLLWKRAAAHAARVLLAFLLLWWVVWKVPVLFRAPAVAVSWESWAETTTIVAAAWVLLARFATVRDRKRLAAITGDRGVRIGRVLYGLALVAFGVAHFAYVDHTASLVPGWIPAHVAWVEFTGGAFIAAGAALLVGVAGPLAAALSAVQIGGFTLLVWVPAVVATSRDPFVWAELVVSSAITAAGWVVADSYREGGRPRASRPGQRDRAAISASTASGSRR